MLFLSTSLWLSLYIGEFEPTDGRLVMRLRGSFTKPLASRAEHVDSYTLSHPYITSDEFGSKAIQEPSGGLNMKGGQVGLRNFTLQPSSIRDTHRESEALDFTTSVPDTLIQRKQTAGTASESIHHPFSLKHSEESEASKKPLAVNEGTRPKQINLGAHVWRSSEQTPIDYAQHVASPTIGDSGRREHEVPVQLTTHVPGCNSQVSFLGIPASTLWLPATSSISDDSRGVDSNRNGYRDHSPGMVRGGAAGGTRFAPLGFEDFTRAYSNGRVATQYFDSLRVQRDGAKWRTIIERVLLAGPLSAQTPNLLELGLLSFTVVIFCCLDSMESALAPFAVAAHSRASVLAVHACKITPDLHAVERARDTLGLNNLVLIVVAKVRSDSPPLADLGLFPNLPNSSDHERTLLPLQRAADANASKTTKSRERSLSQREQDRRLPPKKGIADDDDDGSRVWRTLSPAGGAVEGHNRQSRHVGCDVLLLLPTCIATLLGHFLPREAELLVSYAIAQCGTTALLLEGHWPYYDIWPTADDFVHVAAATSQEVHHSAARNLSRSFALQASSQYKHIRSAQRRVASYHLSGEPSLDLVVVTDEIPLALLRNGFDVAALRLQFTLSDREAVHLIASALEHGSNLDCALSGQIELRLSAGILSGCDVKVDCRMNRYLNGPINTATAAAFEPGQPFNFSLMSSQTDHQHGTSTGAKLSLSRLPSHTIAPASRVLRSSKSSVDSIETSTDAGWSAATPASHGSMREPHGLDSSDYMRTDTNELMMLSRRESDTVACWWRFVASFIRPKFTALVVGDNLGMLAMKLARKAPLSTFVCRRFARHNAIERMTRVLGIYNLVTALDNDSVPLHLDTETARFTYVLLGSPSVVRYLSDCVLRDWETKIGAALSAASKCAWVEIPRLRLLHAILVSIESDCATEIDNEYHGDEVELIKKALHTSGETRSATIDVLNAAVFPGVNPDIQHNQVAKDETHFPRMLPVDEHLLIRICFTDLDPMFRHGHDASAKNQRSLTMQNSGSVLLQSLLDVGVRPVWKALLLRSHLESLAVWRLAASDAYVLRRDHLRFGPLIDLHNDIQFATELVHVEPWYSRPRLQLFSPSTKAVPPDALRPPPRNETLWHALKAHLRESPAEGRNGHFSLFEWGGITAPVAMAVAGEFPNATVVAIVGDALRGCSSTAALPPNVIYCAGVPIDHGLAIRMYESPEFARYGVLNFDPDWNYQKPPSQRLPEAATRHMPQRRDVDLRQIDCKADSRVTRTPLLELALSEDRSDAHHLVGSLVTSALTSFIPLPSASHISLAMHAIFGTSASEVAARAGDDETQHPKPALPRHVTDAQDVGHPSVGFVDAEVRLFERMAIRPYMRTVETETLLSAGDSWGVSGKVISYTTGLFGRRVAPFPLLRVDMLNLSREVHHHFDWARDGHKRTYKLRAVLNESCLSPDIRRYDLLRGSVMLESEGAHSEASGGGLVKLHTQYLERVLTLPAGHHVSNGRIVHVYLTRDEDGSYIPYGQIRSITLIAAIRLGLITPHRQRAFSAFLRLPLYEDMAPWNIAFTANKLEYIDYDTRGLTYDAHVVRIYRTLSALMNYKRTIEDFDMCGARAKTSYGFPYVSDCVRPTRFSSDCSHDSSRPVPCDDGNCHSDFISCLRAISAAVDDRRTARATRDWNVDTALSASRIGSMTSNTPPWQVSRGVRVITLAHERRMT